MKPYRAPLSREDVVPFVTWWAQGLGVGLVLALLVVLISPLTMDGPTPIVGELAGSVVGWEIWWRLRNLGNEP